MDRRDWYFRQVITEQDLDQAFGLIEEADRAIAADMLPTGIAEGMEVTEHAPAGLTVDLSAGVAYDQAGQRIAVDTAQNVNVAVDSLGVSTAVAVGGNEKWIGIFAQFDRALSDPRIDGNSQTVYFRRDESWKLVVVQGAEAAIGNAIRPALLDDAILLCDVHRTNGLATIVNADLDTSRRQDAIARAGTTWTIRRGTLKAALFDLLDALNAHAAGTEGDHAASDVVFSGGSAWLDGTTNPTADVDTQLAKIVNDLISQEAATSGAKKIGTTGSTVWKDGTDIPAATVMDAINAIINRLADSGAAAGANGAKKVGCSARSAWLGGRANAASDVHAAIDKIITDLAVVDAGDDGAERVGAQASAGGSTYNFAAGSVRTQLDALLSALNGHAAIGAADKHVVARGSAAIATAGEFQTITGDTAWHDVTDGVTPLAAILSNLLPGDIIDLNSHVQAGSGASHGGMLRAVVVIDAAEGEIAGATMIVPVAASAANQTPSGQYTMTESKAAVGVKLQARSLNAANTVRLYGGACLRATVLR